MITCPLRSSMLLACELNEARTWCFPLCAPWCTATVPSPSLVYSSSGSPDVASHASSVLLDPQKLHLFLFTRHCTRLTPRSTSHGRGSISPPASRIAISTLVGSDAHGESLKPGVSAGSSVGGGLAMLGGDLGIISPLGSVYLLGEAGPVGLEAGRAAGLVGFEPMRFGLGALELTGPDLGPERGAALRLVWGWGSLFGAAAVGTTWGSRGSR
mmetsp:Transcript_36865/g.90709  ORF Transcript_36865/g.90709 Transcript_36865/m.90709 type:complete len:213 (+) Transcript_36865:643-1281(+)